MTSRRVFLHVGAPKTGTTYLQDRLALNAKALAKHGVDFPAPALVEPSLFHFRAALDLLGQDWGGEPGHAEGAWTSMVRRVPRSAGTTVISHEILAPASPEVVAKVKHDLAHTELHVVYTARDLARQLPAAWQESIRQGRKWPYARFLRRISNGKAWFYNALDLPSVLSTWSAGLPPERVHLITVPPKGAGRDLLWNRFCDLIDADPAWAPEQSEKLNSSLGVAETQVIRKLNRRLGRITRSADHDDLVRELLSRKVLTSRTSPAVRLPDDMFGWVESETERWLDWIRGSGIDVIGSLEELRPLPRPEDEPFVDPDRVSAKRQLRVAIDALAAMTEEAARRQDPDRQLGRRVRNVVRRRGR